MSEKLTPCPFCGDKAEIVRNFGRIGIACVQCNANFRSESICSETGYDSIFAAWNKRFVCLDKNGDKVYAGDKVKYKLPNWKNKFKVCYVTELCPPFYGYGLTADNDFDFEDGSFFPSEIELIKEAK